MSLACHLELGPGEGESELCLNSFFLLFILTTCCEQVDRLEARHSPGKGNRTRPRIKPTRFAQPHILPALDSIKSIPRPARHRTLHPSLFP